jgi:putative two-component system response regulator
MNGTTAPVVLLVDDTPENLDVLRGVLAPLYSLKIATRGQLALKIAQTTPPDLILLDIMMPDLDGYEVCRRLKASESTRHIPVIFITARMEVESETRGFQLGAADYLTKPISPPVVLARVKAHLALYDQRRHLEILVKERTAELEASNRQLEKTRLAILQRLGRASEYRDNETGMHTLRVGHFSKLLGLAAGFPESLAETLLHAALLHDAGKIGIPDHILLKPDKLTPEEFEIVKKHPRIGAEIIGEHDAELLIMAREIALYHHEKWNGRGYPDGLRGEQIPIAARIVAVADVFDALTSNRPYKAAWPIDQALDLIRAEAGEQFDPALANLFVDSEAAVRSIKQAYRDEEEAPGVFRKV